jgi:hypothetical protein
MLLTREWLFMASERGQAAEASTMALPNGRNCILVHVLTFAQPMWPTAVIARTHLLGEIGRVLDGLYLIHDAVRLVGG